MVGLATKATLVKVLPADSFDLHAVANLRSLLTTTVEEVTRDDFRMCFGTFFHNVKDSLSRKELEDTDNSKLCIVVVKKDFLPAICIIMSRDSDRPPILEGEKALNENECEFITNVFNRNRQNSYTWDNFKFGIIELRKEFDFRFSEGILIFE